MLVVTRAKNNVHVLKTPHEYMFIDPEGHDVGRIIRIVAKKLITLILDDTSLWDERDGKIMWRPLVTKDMEYFLPSSTPGRELRNGKIHQDEDGNAGLQLALEAS